MSKEREIVDQLRSVMYGASDPGCDMLSETRHLAQLLAEYDDVPFSGNKNRLIRAIQYVKEAGDDYGDYAEIDELNNVK